MNLRNARIARAAIQARPGLALANRAPAAAADLELAGEALGWRHLTVRTAKGAADDSRFMNPKLKLAACVASRRDGLHHVVRIF